MKLQQAVDIVYNREDIEYQALLESMYRKTLRDNLTRIQRGAYIAAME